MLAFQELGIEFQGPGQLSGCVNSRFQGLIEPGKLHQEFVVRHPVDEIIVKFFRRRRLEILVKLIDLS